ncbi:MAG: AAA family ATPase [Planctomycetota bacterium]|nr:MAG: AAA family ATPase [Planctomycetota bacterium]
MATEEIIDQNEKADGIQLDSGTYEIIKSRLDNHGETLRGKLQELNSKRKEVFGSIATELLKTERITTDNNCIPRDMISIGGFFIFGYNVHVGLKSELHPEDVLSVYNFDDHLFHKTEHDFLSHEPFREDFKELYKYYKNTTFVKFSILGPYLYAVFRIGKSVGDVKVFKWQIDGENLNYEGNRSEAEFKYPVQHEFEWIRTHRDLHRSGDHPHVSIEDRLFVETVGGDLTIKIEDNTESGEGIYSEAVEQVDQTLDDAEYFYTIIENIILLKIRPYQEDKFRYFAYSEKAKKVVRVDSVEDSCILLPDNHGIIFSNGYFLQNGDHKSFENETTGLIFEKRVASPNGEDYLYAFYNRELGIYILMSYNLIEQQVETPIICNGYSIFSNGEMLFFKTEENPQKHHTVQIWQTPYTGDDFVQTTSTDSFLFKIGNKDLVGGMAEMYEILTLLNKGEAYEGVYVDIVKKAGDILDSYFWLDKEDTLFLNKPIESIKEAAGSAVDEFEKVLKLRLNATSTEKEIRKKVDQLTKDIQSAPKNDIDPFVTNLAALRALRGEVISSKSVRYINIQALEEAEKIITENTEKLSQQCVQFLLEPKSLDKYKDKITEINEKIETVKKGMDAKELEANIKQSSNELEMLIDIVSNLKIDDPTQTTQIIDSISSIFSSVNQTKVKIKNKKKELLSSEGIAEFNSQLKLMSHSIINYLDVSDTPEKCDEYMTKIMVQIEELEGKFSEFDEFIITLTDKREEVLNAFETKKVTLQDARNKKATSLLKAADRILNGIKHRASQFTEINEINGYFASDLMIEKSRDIIAKLSDLGDMVKSDDLQSRLKSLQEETVRQLKDRKELFVDGENIIRLGKHNFTTNTQELDLSIVQKDDEMFFHLAGTNYFEEVTDEAFLKTREVWSQDIVSENTEVYKGEYLVFKFLEELKTQDQSEITGLLNLPEDEFLDRLQHFMSDRYEESYTKGLHDLDGAKILKELLRLHIGIGLLKFDTQSRAMASFFWSHFIDDETKEMVLSQLRGFGLMNELFSSHKKQEKYIFHIAELLKECTDLVYYFGEQYVDQAAEYLFEQLQNGEVFVLSKEAKDLQGAFLKYLKSRHYNDKFTKAIEELSPQAGSQCQLSRDWLEAFIDSENESIDERYIDEVAVAITQGDSAKYKLVDVSISTEVEGITGSHKVIEDGKYFLNYNLFTLKMREFEDVTVKAFNEYRSLKAQLIEDEKELMRLDEFKPRVLSSFVRNKLIDEVYLPMIGDNFAKQMGAAGDQKRTDLMGMLLLVSPPGYGKTTLMEYIANRLGLTFMKINGPALGHEVTSLDPADAPNASAKQEVEKLNLSLEMGDNIMIYLDDIQHCNPEFLQKFISLCDGQRKMEGVYKGKSKTYDLRGRKVAVVMAGNPYTESGDKFQIPDMLANRADTYNLGDVAGDSEEAFKLSYVENSLTSNPVLNKLASSSQKDVYGIVDIAEKGSRDGVEFVGNYSVEEIDEYVNTMKKILRVRDVILNVNKNYVSSAAMQDDYRTEPPFKLQGSYRNMNKIVEKIVSVMNDEELEALIDNHYENEAQTLTTGAESNLLKFNEIKGTITEEESDRWSAIKRTFKKKLSMQGIEEGDKVGQVILQISNLSEGIESIKDALLSSQNKKPKENQTELITLRMVSQMENMVNGFKEGIVEGFGSLPVTEPPSIEIKNRMPLAFVNVLNHQVNLMETWMKSLYDSSKGHTKELKELKATIKDANQDFDKLLANIKAKNKNKDFDLDDDDDEEA